MNFLFIDPTDSVGNFSFSFVLTGDVVDVDKFEAPFGYADLANTLTKFQLVSDPATGGTDVPASAEAVKVVNDKVEARVPSYSDVPLAAGAWYRIATLPNMGTANNAIISISNSMSIISVDNIIFIPLAAGTFNIIVLAKGSNVITKVRFVANTSRTDTPFYLDVFSNKENRGSLSTSNVIGWKFHPFVSAPIPGEGYQKYEFEI